MSTATDSHSGAGGRRIPRGFMLGCCSAAHQVEGGNDNDWTRMEHERPGSIHDGSVSGIACDQYTRYRDDLELCARELHNDAHRFSVEWSRIEPAEGVFDREALQHYADVARTCRDLGMEPIVTLLHFTLPRWLADRGGLLAADAPRLFARFCAAVAHSMDGTVRWWITINEPSIHSVMAYLMGDFPPNHTSLPESLRASGALLRMHAAAATALRRVGDESGRDLRISVAHHERRMRPEHDHNPIDTAVSVLPDFLLNRWFLRSCVRGRVLPPVGRGERVTGLRGSLDYIGLNYYTEEVVAFDVRSPGTLFSRQRIRPGTEIDTFGNGIDPGGLHRALMSLWEEFGMPILITENGVADTDDELRGAYLVDHLAAVIDALHDGADVRGYLHWTQLDNFEWSEGYAQHFGLYAVDRETLARRAKPSAALYGEICRTRTLSAPASPGVVPVG